MQVTLVLDSARMGETFEQVFGQLTPEDRRTVALETMKAFLVEPGGERASHEAKVMEGLRKRNTRVYVEDRGTCNAADVSDDSLRRTRDVREEMEKFRSVRERMVEQIVDAAIAEMKARVAGLVKEDPRLQLLLQTVAEGLSKALPVAVHDACVAWVCGHMAEVAERAYGAARLNTEDELRSLRQRLTSIPGY